MCSSDLKEVMCLLNALRWEARRQTSITERERERDGERVGERKRGERKWERGVGGIESNQIKRTAVCVFDCVCVHVLVCVQA